MHFYYKKKEIKNISARTRNADMHLFENKEEIKCRAALKNIKIYIPAFGPRKTPVCKRHKKGGKSAPHFFGVFHGRFYETPESMLFPAIIEETPERLRRKVALFL